MVNCDLLYYIDTTVRVKGTRSVKVAASFISPLREIQQGVGPLPLRLKKEIYVTSGHIGDLKWADAIAHTSVSLSTSHPHTGLFMAQCMAHKKESTLHNYCLINWPIFYVVGEAADRLQIICQFFLEDVCLTGPLSG